MSAAKLFVFVAAALVLAGCGTDGPTASGRTSAGAQGSVNPVDASTPADVTASAGPLQAPATTTAVAPPVSTTTASVVSQISATTVAFGSPVAPFQPAAAAGTTVQRTLPSETSAQLQAAPTVAEAPVHLVAHSFPVAKGVKVSYGHTHHDYPATDIFAACGSQAVAAVDGVVTHVRYEDGYVSSVDDPAIRGGRSIAILGDDGVRYYASHFASIDPLIQVGVRVKAGDPIAIVGKSGDAGVCHVHFGLSPNCEGPEWAVRRGVIYPWMYLDAWRSGKELSPVTAIATWSNAHPGACSAAMVMPDAAEAN